MTQIQRLLGASDNLELPLDIARGVFPALSSVRKFGLNPSMDSGDPATDVWEFGGSQPEYIFPAWGTAPVDRLSSDNAADTAEIMIQGLDIEGYEVLQAVTLDGVTPVALTTPLWRVYRMWNNDLNLVTGRGTDLVGYIYCFEDTAVVAGVPTDATKVRAVINDGNNQTQMMVYTVPKGKVGYMVRGEVGLQRGGNQAVSATGKFRVRLFGGVFRVSKTVGIISTGNSYFWTERSVYQQIPELTDIVATIENVSLNGTGFFAEISMILETLPEAQL